jgi:ubiquinol-cytochrome c reductase cytochrome b subunit
VTTEHAKYRPQSGFGRWREPRLPISSLLHNSFVSYPTPRNLNYLWSFGAIVTFMLAAGASAASEAAS